MTGPDLAAAFAALERLAAEEEPTVDLFAVTRSGTAPPEIRRVLLDEPLSAEFAAAARDKAADLADRTPRPYAPAAELSRGEVMYSPADTGLLAGLQEQVLGGDADPYDPSADYVEDLRLLVAQVATSDRTAVSFYRELRPTARLDRSRWFAAFWAGDRYQKVTQDNVLLFDRRFDAVVAGGVALYTSKAVFERIFDFVAEMERNARETFSSVAAGLRIDGVDALEQACTTNPAMMAKMASIRRRLDADPEYQRLMTMERLVAFVREHPETGVEVVGTGDEATLRHHSDPRRRFKILRLLDDDYLSSYLTNRTYEANSKSDPL